MNSVRRQSGPSLTLREIEEAYLSTAAETASDVIAMHRASWERY